MSIETRVTRLERRDSPAEVKPVTRIVLVPLRGPGEPDHDPATPSFFYELTQTDQGKKWVQGKTGDSWQA